MTNFGERLKELRIEKRLTQEQLAEKFFLNKSSVSRYERSLQVPEVDLLQKIAEYFNVSIDYLLGRTEIRNYKDQVFNSDIAMLNKYYELAPDDLKSLITMLVDKFTLLIFRQIQKNDKETLVIYKDILTSLNDFKLGIKDIRVKSTLSNVQNSLTEIMEVQAKCKNDMNLLVDKLTQAYLYPINENKKAQEEMSSALEKHA